MIKSPLIKGNVHSVLYSRIIYTAFGSVPRYYVHGWFVYFSNVFHTSLCPQTFNSFFTSTPIIQFHSYIFTHTFCSLLKPTNICQLYFITCSLFVHRYFIKYIFVQTYCNHCTYFTWTLYSWNGRVIRPLKLLRNKRKTADYCRNIF
jgi:hypothetical protein